MIAFNFHPERCVGCGSCVTTCLDLHDIDLDRTAPYRRLYKKETAGKKGVRLCYYSVACMHCPEMPCAAQCPKGCFRKDAESGLTVLDNSECIGCGRCARICPYTAIALGAEKKAEKCSGCAARIEEGRLPACVAACPRDAITIDDRNAVLEAGRAHLADCARTWKPAY